jgi:hypothetical protein
VEELERNCIECGGKDRQRPRMVLCSPLRSVRVPNATNSAPEEGQHEV